MRTTGSLKKIWDPLKTRFVKFWQSLKYSQYAIFSINFHFSVSAWIMCKIKSVRLHTARVNNHWPFAARPPLPSPPCSKPWSLSSKPTVLRWWLFPLSDDVRHTWFYSWSIMCFFSWRLFTAQHNFLNYSISRRRERSGRKSVGKLQVWCWLFISC